MEIEMGTAVAKAAMDLVKNENVLNKASGLLGMLFPYFGIKQKTVNMYLDEIEKSDLSPETKIFMALNTKKTFKRIQNQKAIAEIALKNADNETDFSEESKVSEEWLERFMNSAGFVSSEEAQLIWGRILSNEFKKPGSTPPNMIRVLSEITPELARAFRAICGMSVAIVILDTNGNVVRSIRKIVVPYNKNEDRFLSIGLSFDILTELDTLGVIRFDPLAGYITKGITGNKALLYVNNQLKRIEGYKDGAVPIGNVLLTSVGNSLFAITETMEVENYNDMIEIYIASEGISITNAQGYAVENYGEKSIIKKVDENN